MENFLHGVDWNAVVANLVAGATQVILVLILLAVANRVLCGLLTPALRRAVRAQMIGRPEIEAEKRAETVAAVIYHSLWIAVLFVGIIVILSAVGLNIVPVVAGVGIGGLALGLGAQSLVRDALYGLLILGENQYGKGDIIQIGTITGVVEELNLRRTVVRDLDGAVHSIPNGEVRISTNLTRDWSRVHLHVAILFGEDIERACETINRVGEALAADIEFQADILSPPRADRIESLSEKGLAIKVLGMVAPGAQWRVTSEFLRRITEAFAAERIEVPYPLASRLKPEPPKLNQP